MELSLIDSADAITRAQCQQWDDDDVLSSYRTKFELPDDIIYLDGNSLGPLPRTVAAAMAQSTTTDWGVGLIRSWNSAGWFNMPQRLGDRLAPLMGANAGEVVVTDSTSINLYKALSAALSLRPDRNIIVSEIDNFPTDLYITEGVQSVRPSLSRRLLGEDADDLGDLINEDVAVVLLTHVNYKTGRIHDMQSITELAHRHGALVIWDLAHSLGVLPLTLNQHNVDFAVGCTYKYLNGGPGAPAFVFVASRHLAKALQPLTGWFGHQRPFDFSHSYDPAGNIKQYLCGTPPVLSMVALDAALGVYDEIDLNVVRTKSRNLTDLFIKLVDQQLASYGFEIRSPRQATDRGSHVSLAHDQAFAIVQALIDKGVIGDFRAPDNMRFGFAPLFNSHVQVWDAVQSLTKIMKNEIWRKPEFNQRQAVT